MATNTNDEILVDVTDLYAMRDAEVNRFVRSNPLVNWRDGSVFKLSEDGPTAGLVMPKRRVIFMVKTFRAWDKLNDFFKSHLNEEHLAVCDGGYLTDEPQAMGDRDHDDSKISDRYLTDKKEEHRQAVKKFAEGNNVLLLLKARWYETILELGIVPTENLLRQ
ncbi:unnamed protein product [Oikopleura dioica]|uniref:Uncharacterized protein n=1 Tax=Oikopleura dioica TaxID=34765 RepID=E4XVC1_OIKDI|nr:unnamed protein product [Oikopleura dioica]